MLETSHGSLHAVACGMEQEARLTRNRAAATAKGPYRTDLYQRAIALETWAASIRLVITDELAETTKHIPPPPPLKL